MSQTLIKTVGQVNGLACRSLICRSLSSLKSENAQDRASPQQLIALESQVVQHLPKFFSHPHPLDHYTSDVKFINNIRGVQTQGLTAYALQLSLYKTAYFLKYTGLKVELLNLVKNPEESFLRIRWRIVSKPGFLYLMLFFWRFNQKALWTDGISTLHVNNQGKIYCHVCDNIDIGTDDTSKTKQNQGLKTPLVDRGLNV